jgi:hypothetical protein
MFTGTVPEFLAAAGTATIRRAFQKMTGSGGDEEDEDAA